MVVIAIQVSLSQINLTGRVLLVDIVVMEELSLQKDTPAAAAVLVENPLSVSMSQQDNRTNTSTTMVTRPSTFTPLKGKGYAFVKQRPSKTLANNNNNNIDNDPNRQITSRKRMALFHDAPEFSEQLVNEFIHDAAQEHAKLRKAQTKKKAPKRDPKPPHKKVKTRKVKTKTSTKHAPKSSNTTTTTPSTASTVVDKKKPPPSILKVPTPIFVPSLPKSGTTTTHKYFECGGQKSVHLTGRNNGTQMFKIGRCVHQNIREGHNNKGPFANCGEYDVWSDTGYVAARNQNKQLKNRLQCFYPLIDALDEVYSFYPNATFLFVVRETESWLKSIQSYRDGFIMELWRRCRSKGFPGRNATLQDFRVFYEWHKQMIREFVGERPSLTYIEVELEAPDVAQILQEKVGIDARCWGHHNQQESNMLDDHVSNEEMDEEEA